MSTYLRPLGAVDFAALFDGRLDRHGIREHVSDKSTEKSRCLTDGENWLWCSADDTGQLSDLTIYAQLRNAPYRIMGVICEEFGIQIVSEHQPQYWGFETQEEWDAFEAKIAEEHRERFYHDVLKYVRSEPNDIRPGTIGEKEAEIAKELIAKDPDLAGRKDDLLDAINRHYKEHHAVKVSLTDEDIEKVVKRQMPAPAVGATCDLIRPLQSAKK